ncbi:MAG: 50S ribosomal protein L17 [Sphingobacteriia bacterium]|nr:50S ribosomal protein L17 [Sphingobacteriia bacterium]
MRHGKTVNHLGRTASHRKALLSNMANSLILHKRITTTLAKAKALRKFVEPLITRSKQDTMHSRRTVFSYLQNKDAVKELFSEISDKVATRNGGYTRILKLGFRHGDNAEIAMIELVDFNEFIQATPKKKATSRRRKPATKKVAETASEKTEVIETPSETSAPEASNEATTPENTEG